MSTLPRFRGSDFGIPDDVPCPFCGRRETELHSAFGAHLSVVTYWCRPCHTAFEWMKWDDEREHPPARPTGLPPDADDPSSE
ncbi:MAG TPA: hypothetical protein VMK65_01555 [Longimicrobiales bacterium]|nr:hypothetical protein [Longimicrobiales bacterium]